MFYIILGHSHVSGHRDDAITPKPMPGRRRTHVTIDGLESQHLMSSHQVIFAMRYVGLLSLLGLRNMKLGCFTIHYYRQKALMISFYMIIQPFVHLEHTIAESVVK